MNICNNTETKQTNFIVGNLYTVFRSHLIHMYTGEGKGVCLNSGTTNIPMTVPEWEDVTDQYCLQKISKGTKC